MKKIKDEILLYGFLAKISKMIKAVSIYKQIVRKRQIALITDVIANLQNAEAVYEQRSNQNYIIFSLSYPQIFKYVKEFVGQRHIKLFIVTSNNIMKILLSKMKSAIYRINIDYFVVTSSICRKFNSADVEMNIIQKINILFNNNCAYIVSNKNEYFASDLKFTDYYLDVNHNNQHNPTFKLTLLKEIKKIFMEINILDAANSDNSIEESTKRRGKLLSKMRALTNAQSQNYNQV